MQPRPMAETLDRRFSPDTLLHTPASSSMLVAAAVLVAVLAADARYLAALGPAHDAEGLEEGVGARTSAGAAVGDDAARARSIV